MRIFEILSILFLATFCVTTGLECYFCAQMDVGPGEKDCEVDPPDKYIRTCNGNPANGAKAIGDPVCIIGTHKLYGYKVIQRSCEAAEVPGNLDGVCTTVPDQCYPNIGCFLGTKRRHCTSDRCNGVTVSDSDVCDGMPNTAGELKSFTLLASLSLGIACGVLIII